MRLQEDLRQSHTWRSNSRKQRQASGAFARCVFMRAVITFLASLGGDAVRVRSAREARFAAIKHSFSQIDYMSEFLLRRTRHRNSARAAPLVRHVRRESSRGGIRGSGFPVPGPPILLQPNRFVFPPFLRLSIYGAFFLVVPPLAFFFFFDILSSSCQSKPEVQ